MNTNKLIGKKVRGFKFDVDNMYYSYLMDKHIGQIGTIINYDDKQKYYDVDFGYKQWAYPAELIEQHLVEENPLDDLPIIGEGVLMEVSRGNDEWLERNVFGKSELGFLAWYENKSNINLWDFARPIVKTKITRKEFEQKFEIID
jgi:hypothetical protein